jgi:DNA-directed RNA polymerase subunit RPC12/RpoP
MIVGDVHDRDIIVGLVVAGVLWLLLQLWLWRPAVRFRRSLEAGERGTWVVPLLGLAAVAAIVIVASQVIGARPWDDRQMAVAALSLVGGGVVVALWLPAIFVHEQGRPVTSPSVDVLVRCPQCGHSMAGLHTARCPECGASYTLDALIREQGYE